MGIGNLILIARAGWINRQQRDVIAYLQEEVRVLKELQGRKRLGGPLRYYHREEA